MEQLNGKPGVNMTFNNQFQNKKVIVTGHTGFKGSWLSVWLLQLGATVYGISKDIPTEPSMFTELQLEKKLHHYKEDIRDLQAIKNIVAEVKPDFLFHLAAQPIVAISYQDPLETITTNIVGTANILEALRFAHHACYAIMITSDKCYDNVEWTWGYRETDGIGGKDPYSASKGGAELMIKTYYHSWFSKPDAKVKLVSVRAGNVIGGGDWAANRIVPDCIKAWQKEVPVEVRNPNATRPWQHVLEPLSGYLRVAQLLSENGGAYNGEPYNFGPNADQSFTVFELLQRLSKYWHFKSLKQYFHINENRNFHEAGLLKLNCDKALHDLQWKPVMNFEETAEFTATWYDCFYNAAKSMNISDFTAEQIKKYTAMASQKGLAWAN
jgi:CDP-glucose 4,6-dehydratase